MKKLATNTLATLVLIGVMSLSSVNVSAIQQKKTDQSDIQQQIKQLERVYQRHDRKLELRASLLGMSADELRDQLRKKPLEAIIKKHGFRDKLTFYVALTGKLKDELRRRGWSEKKLTAFIEKRLVRLTNPLSVLSPSAV